MFALPTWLLSALVLLPAGPNERKDDDVPPNDPSTCTYFPDRESLRETPFLSLGGFAFGRTTTGEVDEQLAGATIYWVETQHFEIGYALGSYKVPAKEAKLFAREFDLLREEWEDAPTKPKRMDPWLRALLFAWRCERLYDKVSGFLGVQDNLFPPPNTTWMMDRKFMGLGPHLGQSGKFEVLMLPGSSWSKKYLSETFGLLVEDTQRWNCLETDSLMVVLNDEKSGMQRDSALYGHVAYNLAIQLLDGYKHYSYEIPCYLRSGLGHILERDITLDHSTFDISEGGDQIEFFKSDWLNPLEKIVKSGDVPRLAELVNIDDYSDMDLNDHLASWGLTQFLLDQHPEGYAGILDAICGLTNESGHTDGSGMTRHHREAISEHLGMSYLQLDAAFAEWVLGDRAEDLNDKKTPRWR